MNDVQKIGSRLACQDRKPVYDYDLACFFVREREGPGCRAGRCGTGVLASGGGAGK
jgi:hypothetical protein